MNVAIRGIGIDQALRARIRARLSRTLRRLTVAPVGAVVTFLDDDGPKGGPARRCAVTVRLPYRPAIRVEHAATVARTAFDGAVAALERRLERYRERAWERRRYPKKYYVAKRLLVG